MLDVHKQKVLSHIMTHIPVIANCFWHVLLNGEKSVLSFILPTVLVNNLMK